MIQISRRQMLVSTAAAAAVSGSTSTMAVAQAAAPSGGAAWDLRDIFPTDAAWDAERQSLLKAIPGLKAYQGKLGESAATLKTALQAQSDLNRRASRLYTYASLKADEDVRVAPNQERKQQAQDVFTALSEATSWANPEIVARGSARVNALIAADPGRNKFRLSLNDTLRLAPHTLSPAEEQLLASASTGSMQPRSRRRTISRKR